VVKPIPTILRPLFPADDVDYAAAFAILSDVHSRMQRDGVSAELLLRRGHARYALGNFLAAAFDAERVARAEPAVLDAQYLKGQACRAMAAVKFGVVRPGVGVYLPPEGLPSRRHLLDVAAGAFETVLRSNPDDAQARRSLKTALAWKELLEAHGQGSEGRAGAMAS